MSRAKGLSAPRSLCVASLLLLCGLTSTAAALEELETLEPLPPMERDQRAPGWEWHYQDQKGNSGSMTLVAGTGDTASYERTDGCNWTRPVKGFAPATQWSGCPSSGTSSVTLGEQTIWPLEVGRTFEWTMSGRSNLLKRRWQGYRRCNVLPSVKVRTVLGVFDTHKVHCKERWGARTWWLSPEIGTAIAYRQVTRRGTILQEMTRIKP